jgi:hypothetical protein
MNHQFHWTQGTRLQLGAPLPYDSISWKNGLFEDLWKLGFFSVRDNAISELGVDFEKHYLGDCG